MRITKISRMRNCRVFDDFGWPQDGSLDEFGKFNLIYGWNGSGKSTISEIFRNLERREPHDLGEVRVAIDGRDVWGDQFPHQPSDALAIKVFNQDFVRANVFPVKSRPMEPIIIVGEHRADAKRRIVELDQEHRELLVARDSIEASLTQSRRLLEQHMRFAAKLIKDAIGEAADSDYRNYNRGDYKARAEQMLSDDDSGVHVLMDDEHDRLMQRQRAALKPQIAEPVWKAPDVASLTAQTTGLLARTVPSEDSIDELVHDSTLEDWVRIGVELHLARSDRHCLFCAQDMPQPRMQRLRQHFNDAHSQLIRDIEAILEDLDGARANVDQVPQRFHVAAKLYDDLVPEYDEAFAAVTGYANQLHDVIQQQSELLMAKKDRVHETILIDRFPALPSVDATEGIAAIIRKHNERSAAFTSAVSEARLKIESHMVAIHFAEFAGIAEEIKRSEAELRDTTDRVNDNRREVRQLRAEVLDHYVSATQMNRDLRSCLGSAQLQLEVKEQGYTLVRNGVPADGPAAAPSDGEKNVIALLYFLQSLRGQDFNLDRGVVVLDDPVSSLDEHLLHLAAGYIRTQTRGAQQLFVFTHNFSFFRQVRDWFASINTNASRDGNSSKLPARFYMLRSSVSEDDLRTSTLTDLDPLLLKYQSDYHYLFSLIHTAASQRDSAMADNYALPNVIRRFLEAFLGFKLPGPQTLRDKLNHDSVKLDAAQKARIVSFVHTHSHDDVVDAPQHDPSVLYEAPFVAKHVLDLVKQMDLLHYERLERITTRSRRSTGR